jgi:hypothetical protein
MKLTIMTFGPFTVRSYGNGTAYDVQYGPEHFFLQGDDAAQFREECECAGWAAKCAEYMDAIGEIYA